MKANANSLSEKRCVRYASEQGKRKEIKIKKRSGMNKLKGNEKSRALTTRADKPMVERAGVWAFTGLYIQYRQSATATTFTFVSRSFYFFLKR